MSDKPKLAIVSKPQMSKDDRNRFYARKLATCDRRFKEYVQSIPKIAMNTMMAVLCGISRSRIQIIKAKCLDCCQFDRKAIAECSTQTCPLYEYRPFKKNNNKGK